MCSFSRGVTETLHNGCQAWFGMEIRTQGFKKVVGPGAKRTLRDAFRVINLTRRLSAWRY